MKELMIAKIERNFERVDTFKWCIDLIKQKPKEFRLCYEGIDYCLERWFKTINGWRWIRVLKAEPER